jgi:adenylate kinase
VSTGEILRKAVREQTPLGEKAAEYVDKGQLVPDDVMVRLAAGRLRERDCEKGFILDGFPRTVAQAEGLEGILREMSLALDSVLCMQVPHAVIIQRLAGRRTCKACGRMYHIVYDPPGRKELCDQCGGELYQREDDREEMVAARLHVYETQTTPLKEYYRERELLKMIDGVGRVEEVRARVLRALENAS